MKEFLDVIRRYAGPYKKYLAGSIILNILSAVFNIFSFTLIIPILRMIFNMDETVYELIPWNSDAGIKEMLLNNIYYYMSVLIQNFGPSMTLLMLGLFLGVMTALKTSCYFGSSAVMVPIKTGIVSDIRNQVYSKVLSLPLGFFSQERKGDIIARISGDVGEVE